LSPCTATAPVPDIRTRRGLIAIGRLTGLLASLLLLACLAPSARADDRVYWANDGPGDNGRISFADLDGSGGGDLLTTGPEPGHVRGMAMDVAAGRAYLTLPGASAETGQIVWASLDNTGAGSRVNTAGATKNHPNGAAVYPAEGKVYWANEDGNTISFANLNNTGGGDLNTGGATVRGPLTPMVDPGSRRIYWANVGNDLDPDNIDAISWANLDGSGGANVITADSVDATVVNPHGVALDPVAGRIYWTNRGDEITDAGQGISWANLNGSGAGDLNLDPTTVNVPIGVTIDPDARKLYWANWGNNTISVANLDGTGERTLNTGGATPSGSRSPVLLKAPIGTGAPTITGGSSAGSVLTCSQGSWAPDLLSSWLYRVPRSLTYSWTRNGAAIPGASGITYTPSAGGDHRCTVTGSNPAGSFSQTSAAHALSPPPPPPPPAGKPPAGGSSKTSAAKAAFGTKTLVTMKVAARRIPGRGPIKVVIRNANGFQVLGRLSARATISARATKRVSLPRAFRVGSKGQTSVTLKLSKTVRRLLKREGKLTLRLTATVRDPAGGTRTVRKTASVRLKTA
jgi:DNA-binding beta-propeller fold protein YncE